MRDLLESLPEKIERHAIENDVPSLVVGIAKEGKPIFARAFGYADINNNRPASTAIPYSVASLTKPFLGTLIAIFVERGLIDLNRSADDYLADAKLNPFVGPSRGATIGRLANHTSGLPLYYQFYFDDGPDRPPSMNETIRRYGNIVTPPDEIYNYSNLGYGILGYIIERVAGKALQDVFRDEVFHPLGLEQSIFVPTADELSLPATRYDAEAQTLPHYVTDHPAASELFTSIDDLLKFGSWHLGHGPDGNLSLSGRQKTRTPLSGSASAQRYGLGWGINASNKGTLAAHSGGMPGVSSRLMVIPPMDMVIALISNIESDAVEKACNDILAAFDIQWAPRGADPQTQTYAPEPLQAVWKGAIETYEGNYDLELDLESDEDQAVVCGEPANCVLRYTEDSVTGWIDVELDTSDARKTQHTVEIDLHRRGAELVGVATAITLPGGRSRNALSYPARLRS